MRPTHMNNTRLCPITGTRPPHDPSPGPLPLCYPRQPRSLPASRTLLQPPSCLLMDSTHTLSTSSLLFALPVLFARHDLQRCSLRPALLPHARPASPLLPPCAPPTGCSSPVAPGPPPMLLTTAVPASSRDTAAAAACCFLTALALAALASCSSCRLTLSASSRSCRIARAGRGQACAYALHHHHQPDKLPSGTQPALSAAPPTTWPHLLPTSPPPGARRPFAGSWPE